MLHAGTRLNESHGREAIGHRWRERTLLLIAEQFDPWRSWAGLTAFRLRSLHQAATRIPRDSSRTDRNSRSGATHMARFVSRKGSQITD